MSIVLSQETFHQLREFIHGKSGLSFSDGKKYLIESRLRPRLQAVHCGSFEDYFNFIRFDPGREMELIKLLNCVTTNETFFFRDISQMDCFRQVLLPQLMMARERSRSIKIWSAGCSSGEEPYTLAVILAEEFPCLANWDVQILATDLSEQVLQAAEKGIYGPYAVRNIPPAYLKKYFTGTEGKFHVGHTLKQYVKFFRLNLFDSLQMQSMKGIDLIFCRNVLIYLDQDVRKRIVSHFYDSLKPSGSLMIGFSESLSGVNRLFRPIPWHKTFFYAKADQELPVTLEPVEEVARAHSTQQPPGENSSFHSEFPAPVKPATTGGGLVQGIKSQIDNDKDGCKFKGRVS